MGHRGRRHDHDHHDDHDFPPPPPPGPGGERDVFFFRGGPGGPGGPFMRPFPPPWAAGRRMRRGGMRVALLSALQDGAAHGYELMGRLEQRSGGRWRPSPGSVYPTLQALEDEGLVKSSESEGKKVYELTDAGRTEATAQTEAGGPPWMGMGGPDGGPHAKLRNAVMQLGGACQQVAASGSPELVEKAEQVVTEARRKLYQLLAEA